MRLIGHGGSGGAGGNGGRGGGGGGGRNVDPNGLTAQQLAQLLRGQ